MTCHPVPELRRGRPNCASVVASSSRRQPSHLQTCRASFLHRQLTTALHRSSSLAFSVYSQVVFFLHSTVLSVQLIRDSGFGRARKFWVLSNVRRSQCQPLIASSEMRAFATFTNNRLDLPFHPSLWPTCRSCLPGSKVAPLAISSNSNSNRSSTVISRLLSRRLSSLPYRVAHSLITILPLCHPTHPWRVRLHPNKAMCRTRRRSSSQPTFSTYCASTHSLALHTQDAFRSSRWRRRLI